MGIETFEKEIKSKISNINPNIGKDLWQKLLNRKLQNYRRIYSVDLSWCNGSINNAKTF